MNELLLYIGKGIIWTALVLIVLVEIHDYVNNKINMNTYEEMAKKHNCQFLTPSASRRDVGMFQCDGKIEFMKLED